MKLQRVLGALVVSLAVPAFAAAQAGAGGAGTSGATGGGAGTSSGTVTDQGGGAGSGTGSSGTVGTRGGTTTTGTSGTGTTGQTGTTGTTTGTTATGQTGTTSGSSASTTTSGWMSDQTSHWLASGFVGSNFGASANAAAPDFGGSVGYLYKNWIGGEFLAGFTPNFEAQNLALFSNERPQVNSYMANAIASLPLGADANWQPFISGGFGAVTLRSSANGSVTTGSVSTNVSNAVTNTFAADDTRGGGNIGAGLMGFVGNWGIRGDVRYFRAFTGSNNSNVASTTGTGSAATTSTSFLQGLDFWRANIGVAFRW